MRNTHLYRAQPRARTSVAIALIVLAFGLGLAPTAAHAQDAWTLVAVPDTQHYTDHSSYVDNFIEQMTWIADNVDSEQIKFVSHLGDIVQHGDSTLEWNRAESAMQVIHGVVPYSVAIGDHDYADEEDRDSGAEEYVARYGAARYAGQPWYGGAAPDQKSHYQLFQADGRQFLHLALEWEAPGAAADSSTPLGWAETILRAHPNTPTIISTHSYIWDKSAQKGRTNGIEEDSANGSSGELIWSELIANNPQVFMVLGGNFHKQSSQYDPTDPGDDPDGPSADGEYHQVSTNLHGLPVYEMLANFQDYPNGGDGWIRLIRFEAGAGVGGQDRISVETYSTMHDAYQTDSLSQFHFDLSFADRFDDIPERFPLQRLAVSGGEDSYVWEREPNRNYGTNSRVRIDTSDGGPQQGLLRFDIDFASLPADAEIKRAELRLAQTDDGDGFALHRMRVAWDQDTVTWNALSGGVDADGSDAEASEDVLTLPFMSEGESLGYSLFDVTDSARAWHAGATNHGWALMPQGDDKILFSSFEGELAPVLIIDYVTDGDDGGGDDPDPTEPEQVIVASGQDTYIWKKQSRDNFGDSDRIRIDYSDGKVSGGDIMPMQGLLRFDIDTAVPADAIVTRAELRIRLTDAGHGFRLHRMLVAWAEDSATWQRFGDGIDDDDAEAKLLPDLITDDTLTEPDPAQYLSFDVTAAVSAWQSGQANHGWALLPLGDNKLIIESFQGTSFRPQLVVEYVRP